MELKITTAQMLKILYVLSWIIFIGVCIEAGSFIFNAAFTLWLNPINANYFGLSNLFAFDKGQFLVELLLMAIPGVLKAVMFYQIVKILHDKKVNMVQPFNNEMGRFIFNISYLALVIGLFSFWGVRYTQWLARKGIQMPDIEHLHLSGADVWLFMGVIVLVIGHIFKRGIEIQSENELTI